MNKDAYYQLMRLRKLSELLYEFHFALENNLKKPFGKKDQLQVSKGLYKHINNITEALELAVNRYEQLADYNKESYDNALKTANEKIISLEKEIGELSMGGYLWK